MSCHEREALTLHHENGPVSRGTAAHGQSDTLINFSNTSVASDSAAIANPSLLRVKRLSGSSGLSGLLVHRVGLVQPNKRDRPNRLEQPAGSHGVSRRTVMNYAG
jgi:hypothetical protein